MLPVSTPAKAASLPLPKSKVNNFVTAGASSFEHNKIPLNANKETSILPSKYKRNLGSPARDLTKQEKIAQRRIDGAQHKFATTYLRKPRVPVGYESDTKVVAGNDVIGHINKSGSSFETTSHSRNSNTRSVMNTSSKKKKHWRPAGSSPFNDSTTPKAGVFKQEKKAEMELFTPFTQKHNSSNARMNREGGTIALPDPTNTELNGSLTKSFNGSKIDLKVSTPNGTLTQTMTNDAGLQSLRPKSSSFIIASGNDSCIKNINTNITSDNRRSGTAKLADLCEEDKMKVAKLIEQLMKLGAENEITAAQFDQEKDTWKDNLKGAQKESAALLEKVDSVQTKYTQSLELIKGYQTRLRELAREKEDVISENRRGKFERQKILQREQELHEEIESLRKKADRQREEIKTYADLEKKQGDLVLKLRAKVVSRDAARVAQERSSGAEVTIQKTEGEGPIIDVNGQASNISPEASVSVNIKTKKDNKEIFQADKIVQSKIKNSTPRTKKELGKVTTAVVSKLENELNEARLALNRLRMEQEKTENISKTHNEDINDLYKDELCAHSTSTPSKFEGKSERHVRIRDTPEMWDGTSVDETNAPYTTRGYPKCENGDDDNTISAYSVPLLSKSLSPDRTAGRHKQDKIMKVGAGRRSINNINSLDVFEDDINDFQRKVQQDVQTQPMWGRTRSYIKKKHYKIKSKVKPKRKRAIIKRKQNFVKEKEFFQSLEFNHKSNGSNYKRTDASDCFYEESLFDLVDQMEELDETVSNASLTDRDAGFFGEMKEGLQVSSSGQHFTGVGFVLAPAPEATRRIDNRGAKGRPRRSSKSRREKSFTNSIRKDEQIDPDVWWDSVGSLLNSSATPKKRMVKVMPAGGRNGDYWGMYTSPRKKMQNSLGKHYKKVDRNRLGDKTNKMLNESVELNNDVLYRKASNSVESKRQVKQIMRQNITSAAMTRE
eukprot:g7587.t1